MGDALRLYDAALGDPALSNERRATLLTDRGVVKGRVGQTMQAIEDFNKAISLFPEYAVVYNNRGALLVKVGALEEALRDFDRAILLAPGYTAAYTNRAGALMRLKRPEDAAASLYAGGEAGAGDGGTAGRAGRGAYRAGPAAGGVAGSYTGDSERPAVSAWLQIAGGSTLQAEAV